MRKRTNKFPLPLLNKGFTLIEVMVSIGVLGILLGVIYAFIIESYKFQSFVSEQNDAISIARDGVEELLYELRETDIADTGAYPIELANDQEFIFYSDVDTDILTERVRYFLEGTTLKKGVIEANYDAEADPPYDYNNPETITTVSTSVQNGSNPLFYYYNSNYPGDTVNNPLATPADPTEIKLIKINLQININPYRVPDTYLLENYVQLRNLKENI